MNERRDTEVASLTELVDGVQIRISANQARTNPQPVTTSPNAHATHTPSHTHTQIQIVDVVGVRRVPVKGPLAGNGVLGQALLRLRLVIHTVESHNLNT